MSDSNNTNQSTNVVFYYLDPNVLEYNPKNIIHDLEHYLETAEQIPDLEPNKEIPDLEPNEQITYGQILNEQIPNEQILTGIANLLSVFTEQPNIFNVIPNNSHK
jgi:hypothetical protein